MSGGSGVGAYQLEARDGVEHVRDGPTHYDQLRRQARVRVSHYNQFRAWARQCYSRRRER